MAGRAQLAVRLNMHKGKPAGGEIHVLPEDYAALRALLKREKIRVYQHLRPDLPTMYRQPTQAERARAGRLAELAAEASQQVDRAKDRVVSASRRRRARTVAPVPARDPAEEAVVRAEAASLRAWLVSAHPELDLTPPRLAADEPPLVRALWEELGYSEELQDVVGWPDRASSRDELARVLELYRGWQSPLRRSALPRQLRLVAVDDQGCGVAVTDEDTPTDDPPVLSANADLGEVSRCHDSYLTCVGEMLAEYATDGQANLAIVTDPPLVGVGEQPYPRLAPEIRQLTATVRAHPLSARATVCAPRFEDLIAWLADTTLVDRLALCYRYLAAGMAARMVLAEFTPPAGLRTWRAPSGDARCHVGTVDGVPVLVETTDTIVLYTPHADRERAAALAAASGWTRAADDDRGHRRSHDT